jgi:hypothetical protein
VPASEQDASSARPAPPVTKIVAAAAAFVLAFFGWQFLHHHDLRLPSSVAGMEKIEAPALQPAIDQLRATAKNAGASGDAAIYGTNNVPSFVVLVVDAKAGQGQDGDTMFQQFATGFSSSGSSSVDTGHIRHGGDGTVTTYCARTRGSIPGGVCMWVDPKMVGFVFYPGQSVGETETLTTSVRAATES